MSGWRLLGAAAGTDDRTLELSFVPGASALSVAVEFRDATGGLVASIDRTLIVGSPDPQATAAAGTAGWVSIAFAAAGGVVGGWLGLDLARRP